MKIRCIAVDDESLALNKISRFAEMIDFLDLVATFDNAIDALQYIREHPVDLMFLDIQMEGFTGIQFLRTVKHAPLVILTTAYEAYALEGYELDVLDYLLKPIPFDRFIRACDKARERLLHERSVHHIPTASVAEKPTPHSGMIFVKSGTSIRRISLSDILFIEGLKDYLLIHTPAGRIITLMTFTRIMQMLPDDKFCRVHKSYIIAVGAIEKVEGNTILIRDRKIPIGITYRNSFQKLMEQRMLPD